MKKIFLSFKFLIFIFWSIFYILICIILNDLKGIYIFGIIGSFPFSYISEKIINIFDLDIIQSLFIIFLIGSTQWIMVGYFIDILLNKYKGKKI